MHGGKLVFTQVMERAPWHTFRRLIAKYRGDFNIRTFSCLDQFLCRAFAQLTYRESLRTTDHAHSPGFARHGQSQRAGRCQRVARLAHPLQVRPSPYSYRPHSVCQGTARCGVERHGLRAGCHHHRLGPGTVSVGVVSCRQSRRQTAHLARFARRYPRVYPYQRRETAQRQRARPAHPRAGRLLM